MAERRGFQASFPARHALNHLIGRKGVLAASPAVFLLCGQNACALWRTRIPWGQRQSLRRRAVGLQPCHLLSPGAYRLFQPFAGILSTGHSAEGPFPSVGSAAAWPGAVAEAGGRSPPPAAAAGAAGSPACLRATHSGQPPPPQPPPPSSRPPFDR